MSDQRSEQIKEENSKIQSFIDDFTKEISGGPAEAKMSLSFKQSNYATINNDCTSSSKSKSSIDGGFKSSDSKRKNDLSTKNVKVVFYDPNQRDLTKTGESEVKVKPGESEVRVKTDNDLPHQEIADSSENLTEDSYEVNGSEEVPSASQKVEVNQRETFVVCKVQDVFLNVTETKTVRTRARKGNSITQPVGFAFQRPA